MRIASRDLRVVSVGLVSAVLLVGCSGNSSKPKVIPALTLSATPAAATTPAQVATAPAPAPATSAAPAATASNATPPSAAPTTATSESSAQTPSASPSPTATSTTTAEALSFVKSYYKTAAEALHSKTALTLWKAMYLSTCARCEADYSGVSKALAAGDRYEGGEYRLVSGKVTEIESAGAVVRVSLYVTAGKAYNSKGALIAQQPATKPSKSDVYTQHSNGHWYVINVQSAA